MEKQVSYQKVLRVMKMKGAQVSILPRVYQSIDNNSVVARAYLDVTVLQGKFLYTAETNVNSETYYVRSLVEDNLHITRNGLRSCTLEDLLSGKHSSIAEDKMDLVIQQDLSFLK